MQVTKYIQQVCYALLVKQNRFVNCDFYKSIIIYFVTFIAVVFQSQRAVVIQFL